MLRPSRCFFLLLRNTDSYVSAYRLSYRIVRYPIPYNITYRAAKDGRGPLAAATAVVIIVVVLVVAPACGAGGGGAGCDLGGRTGSVAKKWCSVRG